NGSGNGRGLPRLAGNASVLAPNADSVIAIILRGSRLPSTEGDPSALAMPAYAWRYNDAEIAELVTFLRTSWGNKASPVAAHDVARVRQAEIARAQSRNSGARTAGTGSWVGAGTERRAADR